MAEDAVVKEQLTDAMVEAGAELVQRLDKSHLPIIAALWMFEPDINEWRLLFASPEVSAAGPRKVYEQVRQALQELGEKGSSVPLAKIGLLDPNAELVQLLHLFIRTGDEIEYVRFSKNVINGHFIDDALIYRVA